MAHVKNMGKELERWESGAIISTGYSQIMTIKRQLCPLKGCWFRNAAPYHLQFLCFWIVREEDRQSLLNLTFQTQIIHSFFWISLTKLKKGLEIGNIRFKRGTKRKEDYQRHMLWLHQFLLFNINGPLWEAAFSTVKVSEDWLSNKPAD